MNPGCAIAAIVCACAAWCVASPARAHGGDAVALEARLHARGLDAITYVGQRPLQRELRNPVNMPLAALPRAELLSRLTERVLMRTRVATAQGACQRGPLLRMEPDPDGQALRVLHRYVCEGALKAGLRVQFDPLPEQRARMFVYGAFYAGKYSYVHTFVGREAELDASRFTQPIVDGEAAQFAALFPPLESAQPAASAGRWAFWLLAVAIMLAWLAWLVRARRRPPPDTSSYAR